MRQPPGGGAAAIASNETHDPSKDTALHRQEEQTQPLTLELQQSISDDLTIPMSHVTCDASSRKQHQRPGPLCSGMHPDTPAHHASSPVTVVNTQAAHKPPMVA
jgi:hypothetical protein